MHARLATATDIALGVGLFLLAWLLDGARGDAVRALLIAGPAVAAALARRWPVGSLVLVWLTALLQVLDTSVVLVAWLALPVLAYRIARHASAPTVWAAGLSVPAGAVAGVALAYDRPETLRGATLLTDLVRASGAGLLSAVLALVAFNAAPFALGLVVRASEGYRRAEARATAEHELAEVRAAQSRLAYDVHDIVGHSLAVIVAQADAAQLTASDERVRATLAQIAATGRSSLADVRAVLSQTRETTQAGDTAPASVPQLDELVDGVRAGGTPVTDRVSGAPGLVDDATAYRALQEMLTNALKHGLPGDSIGIERAWSPHGLTLRVTNAVPAGAATGSGMGLDGLRERLQAAGGSFRADATAERFVATAFVPTAGR